jgi:hypothetical protein
VFISGADAEFTSPLGVYVVPEREQHGVNESPSAHNQLILSRTPRSLLTKKCRTNIFFCPTFFCQLKTNASWFPLWFVVSSSLDLVTNWSLVELAAQVGDGGVPGSG